MKPLARHVAVPVEIHVWTMSLKCKSATLDRFASTLSPDELERANRFHFAVDRNRFVAGRGILRGLLARYVETAPQDVRFRYLEYGKPVLDADEPLSFNLAHSGDRGLLAIVPGVRVGLGVDLEEVRPRPDDDWHVAERFFASGEVKALRTLPESRRARAFFTCWTRKEAFIKARGDGLQLPLREFEVTLLPGTPAALLRTAWSAEEPAHWRLRDLSSFVPGYAAALAIHAERAHVTAYAYDESERQGQRRERSWDSGED